MAQEDNSLCEGPNVGWSLALEQLQGRRAEDQAFRELQHLELVERKGS